MKLVVMFCNIPEIDIMSIPNSIDNIEEYLEEELGYNSDEISWQVYETSNIKVNVLT